MVGKFFAGDSYLPKAGEYLIPARASLGVTLALIHQGKAISDASLLLRE